MTVKAQLTALVSTCILLLIAALTGIYWYSATTHSERLTEQRNHFLLQSLRSTAENYLAIGMTPEQMPAIQSVIDRERASFPQVMAIDVFSPAGLVTYSTDAGAQGARVPADWVEKLNQSGTWETQDPTQDQMGMHFENDLGRPAGGIVLTLVPADRPWTLSQLRQIGTQAIYLIALSAITFILALTLCLWGIYQILHPYRQVVRALNQPETDSIPKDAADVQALAKAVSQKLQQELIQSQKQLQDLQELDNA